VKLIVTGGAGFIGGHLVPVLLFRGHQVLVLDNLFSGRRQNVPEGAKFANLDLARADDSEIFDIVRGFHPDAVIHLAGVHYIPYCLEHPAETFLVNVRSTEILMRAMKGLSTRKLIAASTGDVYSLRDIAHSETETPEPSNSYGLSKFQAEEIIAGAASCNRNLSCIALRLFNVYGPRDSNPHVIPRAIEQLRSPDVPEIPMGRTDTTRDFIHVDDVVRAISNALTHESGNYDVFNVGTGRATSIRDVLGFLRKAAGDQRPIVQDKSLLRSHDRLSLTSDISKITRVMNWRPTVRLEEGLTLLVQQAVLTPA